MKLCKDCDHFVPGGLCKLTVREGENLSLVWDDVEFCRCKSGARGPESGWCGPDAKHWTPRRPWWRRMFG